MSTRYSGEASRSFIIGSRLCPPAITRAPGPSLPSAAIAASTLVARSYSNGPGVCTERPLLGRQIATNTRLVAWLVLHRRIGPDDRRARHPLRVLLADLRVELPRREASVRRVADRRAVRAGRCDRRFATEAPWRDRAIRVDLADPRRLDLGAALEVAQAGCRRTRVQPVDQADGVLHAGLLHEQPLERVHCGVEVRVDRLHDALDGRALRDDLPDCLDRLVEAVRDLAQRNDRRDQVVDERQHDDDDGEDEYDSCCRHYAALLTRRRRSRRVSRRSWRRPRLS